MMIGRKRRCLFGSPFSLRTRIAVVFFLSAAALAIFPLSAPVIAGAVQVDGDVDLVTVVGCVGKGESADSWIIERATEGRRTPEGYTSQDELDSAAAEPLGDREFHLVGTNEFNIEPHVSHKVQVKGLRYMLENEWRLNLTSFQHLAPNCDD